jgi:hypothetical protein
LDRRNGEKGDGSKWGSGGGKVKNKLSLGLVLSFSLAKPFFQHILFYYFPQLLRLSFLFLNFIL